MNNPFHIFSVTEGTDTLLDSLTTAETQAQGENRETLPPIPENALILLPVRNLVLFPGMVVPVHIGRDSAIRAAQTAIREDRQIGVILQKDPEENAPFSKEHLYEVGTAANILRYVTSPSESHHIVCQGEGRFRIRSLLKGYPFLVAEVERFSQAEEKDIEIEGRMVQLKQRAVEILQMMPDVPQEISDSMLSISSPELLSDLLTGLIDVGTTEKQTVLQMPDLKARMDYVLRMLNYRLEVLRVSHDIDRQTQKRLGDRQREALLREQLKTIQNQLGDADAGISDTKEIESAIAKAQMPPEADTHAKKELSRLKNMPEAAGEYAMLRTYLEWLTELPWSVSSRDQTDIAKARKQLNRDHYGLEKIKRRILEFLAVHKLNPKGKSPLLCLVGPPGVGKTSLGQSIARATGRKFVRVSMGGVHDEAEIRGHRRTYLGALPGNIIQAVRRAGANNCVMLLDEIDKLGRGAQGDPAAALLEVLDPEQNSTFRDNYLSLPFDLSGILFICTANTPDAIPGPLRDRMEMIELPGYTEEEKVQIAGRYLVKRQKETNGLTAGQCKISKRALHEIINHYTREAGVRNLEREIGSICRDVAVRVAEGNTENTLIDVSEVHRILGARRFENEVAMRTGMPGVATGLAWTPVGGDILFIEASRVPGKDKLTLTGQLGDVMRESAIAALTLLKARAASLHIEPSLFENGDIHIHVPAGAIPKDGPSAGVAMFLALTSMMMNRPILADHAMTGEISLRGLVLPVGGIKEKVLAALRSGIRTVMLPARNKKDLDDIPKDAQEKLNFIWLETVDDALKAALAKAPPAVTKGKKEKSRQ
ncbi:MAG: endopeptidase La [Alistipes senegalensis]|nr:endopeptidase La [Oxalobacter formigenes]MCM1281444.1 endopeptidase La [Alistipes senegalensis]